MSRRVTPPWANPCNSTSCATPAPSVRRSVARRVPGAVGTKRIQTWQELPAASVLPAHSFERTVKSSAAAPVAAAPVIFAVVPRARTVTGTTVFGDPTSVAGQRTMPGKTVGEPEPGSPISTSPHSAAMPPLAVLLVDEPEPRDRPACADGDVLHLEEARI